MNKTFCERLIWCAMTPTIWKYFKIEFSNFDVAGVKRVAKKEL